jgi:hypothetical protein
MDSTTPTRAKVKVKSMTISSKKRFINSQSGNNVTIIYDGDYVHKYHERISPNLAIVIEGSLDEKGFVAYTPKISRDTDLDTYLETVCTCLDDALSNVETYLESIGVIWGFELTNC